MVDSKRPVRQLAESVTERVPTGPLGLLGGGNGVGGVSYFTVSLINGLVPVDGIDIGFNVESSSVDRGEDFDQYEFIIHSASKDAAKFIAKNEAAPTNVHRTTRKLEIVDVEQLTSNRTFSMWMVRVNSEVRSGGGTLQIIE